MKVIQNKNKKENIMSIRKHKMSLPGVFGIGFASVLLVSGSLVGSSYAEGASSYFDLNTQACIIENYNAEQGTSVTDIKDVEFDKITTLNCSNRGMTNFHGLVLLRNLENLDISYNNSLYGLDFSQNTKLKTINVKGMSTNWFDFEDNLDLETIISDRTLYLTTSAYAEKTDEYGDDEYAIDLSDLKFLNPGTAQVVSFATKDDIPSNITVTFDGYAHQISTRGGWANYAVYLNGDTEVETHNPIYVNNNCEKTPDDYYQCNNAVYYGDVIDTDAIIDDTLSKIFKLDGYKLTKVGIVPPTANVELETDTDTSKKGIVLANSNFTLEFYFDIASGDNPETPTTPTTPDTGFFTGEDGGVSAANVLIVLAGISVVGFVGSYVYHRISRRRKVRRF